MTSLYITISGSDGGHLGPQSIYTHLQQQDETRSIKILSIETIANEIQGNVQRTVNAALEQLNNYDKIYIVGYSMGGAIAVQAALELTKKTEKICGLALLATQTEGLQPLKDLHIPVLFYHGKNDEYFPTWQVEGPYKKYTGPKTMIEVEGLNHALIGQAQKRSEGYSRALASHILHSMQDFFTDGPQGGDAEFGIISATVELPQTFLDKVVAIFKRK
jgi:dienelactone hydrolase